MTLPVPLDDKTEKALRDRAESLQTEPEVLAADILRTALSTTTRTPMDPSVPEIPRRYGDPNEQPFDELRWQEAMEIIGRLGESIGPIKVQDDAFSPEALYESN